MTTFHVLHATAPTFGLERIMGQPIAPRDYHAVAVVTANAPFSDDEMLANIFYATNSRDEPWTMSCRRFREITVTPLIENARSTSVGDVVRIVNGDRVEYHLCELVGWSLADAANVRLNQTL